MIPLPASKPPPLILPAPPATTQKIPTNLSPRQPVPSPGQAVRIKAKDGQIYTAHLPDVFLVESQSVVLPAALVAPVPDALPEWMTIVQNPKVHPDGNEKKRLYRQEINYFVGCGWIREPPPHWDGDEKLAPYLIDKGIGGIDDWRKAATIILRDLTQNDKLEIRKENLGSAASFLWSRGLAVIPGGLLWTDGSHPISIQDRLNDTRTMTLDSDYARPLQFKIVLEAGQAAGLISLTQEEAKNLLPDKVKPVLTRLQKALTEKLGIPVVINPAAWSVDQFAKALRTLDGEGKISFNDPVVACAQPKPHHSHGFNFGIIGDVLKTVAGFPGY